MSLSPDVTPFVPRQSSAETSQLTNVSQSSSWKLSADVAEFVPSWSSIGNAKLSLTQKTKKSSDQTVHKIVSNVGPSKQKLKPTSSSLKTSRITNLSKSNVSEHKPDCHHDQTKETVPSTSSDKYNIESDFPVLGASTEPPHKTPSTIWNKPFGASFSDKLKSNTTSSYFDNHGPSQLSTDNHNCPQKKEQKSTIKSKMHEEVNRQMKMVPSDRLNEKSAEDISKQNKSEENIIISQSEDEGFSVVQGKARKSEKRCIAWGNDPPDDPTKEKVKGVKKFSENRSKSLRERRGERSNNDTSLNEQKHLSSTSDDWRSRRNTAENRKEPRTNNIVNERGSSRQTHKSTKDYYSLKSTHRPSAENKNVNLNGKESGRKKEDFEDVDRVKEIIAAPVYGTAVEARAPLSYSDILKSRPNIQLPNPENVDGNERGILRIPSEGSEEEETEQQEVEGRTKKKKKKKKKKKSTGEAPPQPVKKSKEALSLDLGDMWTKIMESSAAKKKPVIRTGGFLPVQAPLPTKETRVTKKSDLTRNQQATNILDSTAPIVFRSKEREFPKKKKPSAMRKILMKEREEKKMIREGNPPTEKSSDDEENSEESSDEHHLDSDDIDPAEVKKSIHSRKFREYCDQDLNYEINGVVIELLKELIRFQDRLYQKDRIKAKARRRFVCGLREVSKHAKLKKLKCVIVTPNLEPTKSKGGLDDVLSNIIEVCHAQDVPVIFSLNRQVLGKVLLKKVPVSIVGIFYYDGAQNHFKKLMELTEKARETYRNKFSRARENFLLEKQMTKDESPNQGQKDGSIGVQKDGNETVNNNVSIDEENFVGREKDITSDSAVIEAFNENQRIMNNEAMNVETIQTDEEEEEKQMIKDLSEIEAYIQLDEIQQNEDEALT